MSRWTCWRFSPARWRQIRDYSRYLRNAENAGLPEVAYFVHLLMEEDSARVAHCQGLLRKLGSTGSGGQASQPAEHRQ